MIPPLDDGVLPEGIYDCTIDEIEDRFGRIQGSDWRCTLTAQLREYLKEVWKCGFIKAVIVDGSYVTAKDRPDDIDILVVLPADFDIRAELLPMEYNLTQKKGLKRQFKFNFDLVAHPDGSELYNEFLDLFSRVRPDVAYTTKSRKGMLRIRR